MATELEQTHWKWDVVRFFNWLRKNHYSNATLRTYCSVVRVFLRAAKPHYQLPKDIPDAAITEYLKHVRKQWSVGTTRQNIGVLTLFFKVLYKREVLQDFDRPRRSPHQPHPLTPVVIIRTLKHTWNPKHRLMIALLYETGMRVGELRTLRKHHVYLDQRCVVLHGRKHGAKEIPISEPMANMIKDYLVVFSPRKYLLEGERPNLQYATRTIERVCEEKLHGQPKYLRDSCEAVLQQHCTSEVVNHLLGREGKRRKDTHVTVPHDIRKFLPMAQITV